MILRYLQWGRLCILSGKSVPELSHCTGKRFFLMYRWQFLCIHVCPLPLVLLLGITEQNLVHPLRLPFRYLHIDAIPSQVSFLKAEQAQCPQPSLIREMFQSLNNLCNPEEFHLSCPVELKTGHSTLDVPHRAE